MTTKPTAEQVAKLLGVPVENVKAQYARNAASLRKDQAKAEKAGKLRGLTANWFKAGAEHAELQAR